MYRFILAFAIAYAALVTPAQAETLTNDSVIAMVDAGLSQDTVVAKIKASAVQFKIDTTDLISLKNRGIPGPVIAAMIAAANGSSVSANAELSADSPDPLVPHPSGIYLLKADDGTARMMRMDPTTTNQTKTGGLLGYALTGGIASLSLKSLLPNPSAHVRSSSPRPEFYFYFDQANASLSSGPSSGLFAMGPAAAVTSPNEFSLVRFSVKKNRREVRSGSFSIGGTKSGVMDKDRIAFTYSQVSPGIFKVTPTDNLSAGEYGFVYSVSMGSGPGMFSGGTGGVRVFDFGVGLPASK